MHNEDLIQMRAIHYQMIKKMPMMTAKKIAVMSLNQNFTKLHSETKKMLRKRLRLHPWAKTQVTLITFSGGNLELIYTLRRGSINTRPAHSSKDPPPFVLNKITESRAYPMVQRSARKDVTPAKKCTQNVSLCHCCRLDFNRNDRTVCRVLPHENIRKALFQSPSHLQHPSNQILRESTCSARR